MTYFLHLLHAYVSCELKVELVTISAINNYSIMCATIKALLCDSEDSSLSS